jgi:hypothetical protein
VRRHLPRGNLRERLHAELCLLRRRNVLTGWHRDRVHELPGGDLLGRNRRYVREHLHELPERDTLDRGRRNLVLRVRALTSRHGPTSAASTFCRSRWGGVYYPTAHGRVRRPCRRACSRHLRFVPSREHRRIAERSPC